MKTKSYYQENKRILGLIISNYLLVAFNCFCLFFLSFHVTNYFLLVSQNVTKNFNGEPTNPLGLLSVLPIISLYFIYLIVNTVFKTLINQVLLDFITNSHYYKQYSVMDFALAPFKKFKPMTFIYLLGLNILKVVFLFMFYMLVGVLYYLLFKLVVVVGFVIVSLFLLVLNILIFGFSFYILTAFQQTDIALADSLNSSKEVSVFKAFGAGFQVSDGKVLTYIWTLISTVWGVIILSIFMVVTPFFILDPMVLSSILLICLVTMIILVHFYIPYLQLTKVTFYKEIAQSKNISI